MSSETLYRKYRPKNFSEVIGQAHIVRTLSNAIGNNHIGHSYLFTGPRGTGKTSIARIFAKAVNCEKSAKAISCEKCPSCLLINENKSLDIIEIDAASNTGVDNIRELRETINLPATVLRYKVYIIDEVHMLSTGAFNALLKTLEEPPAHVIFILATTEIHKVPETIISRCQRFDFSRLPIQNIIEKLSLIAKTENVKIDAESLEMIAISAEGGMRDAESLLGQIMALEDKNITSKEVGEILGTADKKFAGQLAAMILADDSTAAIAKINMALTEGYNLQILNKALVNYLRQLMLLKISPELKSHFDYELTGEQIKEMLELTQKADLGKIIRAVQLFLEAQSKITAFMLPQLPLEIAIIKATQTLPNVTEQKPVIRKQEPTTQKLENSEQETTPEIQNVVEDKSSEDSPLGDAEIDLDQAKANWNRLMIEIQPLNHSLKALLSTCQVQKANKNSITLGTPYDFYKEKLNDPTNRLTIETVFSKILGSKITLITVLDKTIIPRNNEDSDNTPENTKSGEQESLLGSALEILGGKVVEEN